MGDDLAGRMEQAAMTSAQHALAYAEAAKAHHTHLGDVSEARRWHNAAYNLRIALAHMSIGAQPIGSQPYPEYSPPSDGGM